jgi:malate/lactate dehydrogenase
MEKILELDLTNDEKTALNKSAEHVRQTQEKLSL